MGFWIRRCYKSARFLDGSDAVLTPGAKPVKMRWFSAAKGLILLMIPILLPFPASRVFFASRTNQLDGPLERLEGDLRAA